MVVNAPYFISETNLDLEILSDTPSFINLENIENILPYEVKDKCLINKLDYVFKELIFVKNNFIFI